MSFNEMPVYEPEQMRGLPKAKGAKRPMRRAAVTRLWRAPLTAMPIVGQKLSTPLE